MKKYIGKLVSIKYLTKKDRIYGVVIDFNEDWILLKHNPVDYIVDGYILVKQQHILNIERGEAEKFTEKILTLKKEIPVKRRRAIPITNLETIVIYLSKRGGLFQIQDKVDASLFIGTLHHIDDKYLTIKTLNPKAKWDRILKFKHSEIMNIDFDTDYINSLKLLLK